MWATRSAPPVILCLLRAWYYQHWNASVILKNGKKVLLKLTWNFNFKTTETWQKKKKKKKACGNSCFSSLFAADDVSRGITSATRRQKFNQEKRKIEQIWIWNNPPGRRKKGRGKGEREKRERGEKGREPLPSFPNPPLFSLPPYPPTSSDACFAGYM